MSDVPFAPAEPRCLDCTSTPCARHETDGYPDLRDDRPFDGWQYGIRWATFGEIAWQTGTRAFVEKKYRHPATGEIRSPLTGETGELVCRRVIIDAVQVIPLSPVHLGTQPASSSS